MRSQVGPPRFSLRHKGSSTVTAERSDRLIQPNAQHQYEVTEADLPLACPMPSMHLWNSHPRVFLAIEKTGSAKCPYCSAEYVLKK
ncbi:MAG: zinc-finger domain-containing protein [Proteobacteria bacterium]|nr:zinc-finger domain-containing protein [Pseudomonadota bacterium]